MLDTKDTAFLKSCQFGPKNPYCPIFRLGSVVSWTGSNFQEIALQVGGVPSGSRAWGPGGLRALGLGSITKRVVNRGTYGWDGQNPLPQGLTVFRIRYDTPPVRTQALSGRHAVHLLFGSQSLGRLLKLSQKEPHWHIPALV